MAYHMEVNIPILIHHDYAILWQTRSWGSTLNGSILTPECIVMQPHHRLRVQQRSSVYSWNTVLIQTVLQATAQQLYM